MISVHRCGSPGLAGVNQVLTCKQVAKGPKGCNVEQTPLGSVGGCDPANTQSRTGEQFDSGPPSEKAQMGAVENALFGVGPAASKKKGEGDSIETHVGQTGDHLAAAGQVIRKFFLPPPRDRPGCSRTSPKIIQSKRLPPKGHCIDSISPTAT